MNWIILIANILLVCLTGWYLWETRRRRILIEKQHDTIMKPVLVPKPIIDRRSGHGKYYFVPGIDLVNVGTGTAFDVEMNCLFINPEGLEALFLHEKFYALLPGEKKTYRKAWNVDNFNMPDIQEGKKYRLKINLLYKDSNNKEIKQEGILIALSESDIALMKQ